MTIRSWGGSDILLGRNDADRLAGDAGNNQLFGSNGDNMLSDGARNDLLNGGADDDTVAHWFDLRTPPHFVLSKKTLLALALDNLSRERKPMAAVACARPSRPFHRQYNSQF